MRLLFKRLIFKRIRREGHRLEEDTKKPKINHELIKARDERGWSQEDLAYELSVDVRTIRRWEREGVIPKPHDRRRLMELFQKKSIELGFKSQSEINTSQPSNAIEIPQVDPFVSQATEISSPQDQLHVTKDDSPDAVPPFSPLKTEHMSNQETMGESLPPESSVTEQPINRTQLLVRSLMSRWLSSSVFTVSFLVIAIVLWILSSSIWRIVFSILILMISVSMVFFWMIRYTKPRFNTVPFSQQRRMLFFNAAIGVIDLAGVAGLLSFLFQRNQTSSILPPSPKTLSGHTASIATLAWSSDGIHMASGSQDTTIKIWNTILGKNIVTLYGHTETVSSVAWSPDGTHLVSGSWDHTVKIWDAQTGGNLATYRGHTRPVNSVAWSENGKYIISGSSRPDATVKIWDSVTSQTIQSYSDDKKNVHSVDWSHDSTHIASGTDFKKVYIHRIGEQQPILTYSGHDSQVNTLTWAPAMLKKLYIASGSGSCSIGDNCTVENALDQGDTSIHIWSAETGQDILAIPYQGHSTTVTTIAWSPNGRYIASGSVNPHPEVHVWDTTTGKNIFTYSNYQYNIYTVVWAPLNSSLRGYIASGGSDSNVHIWQPKLP